MNKPLVLILWHDSRDADSAWTSEDDAIAYGEEPCEVYSVGYLVSKGTKFVTIAGDFNPQDKDYGRVTKIPRPMVISMEYLNGPEQGKVVGVETSGVSEETGANSGTTQGSLSGKS